MTVKPKLRRPRGRPPSDPDDLRTERLAIRVHPDLVTELNALARIEGVSRSVMVERLLIRLVNDHHRATIVDAIGRYTGYATPGMDLRPLDANTIHQTSHHQTPPAVGRYSPARKPPPKRR
jgi:hypothetical protein